MLARAQAARWRASANHAQRPFARDNYILGDYHNPGRCHEEPLPLLLRILANHGAILDCHVLVADHFAQPATATDAAALHQDRLADFAVAVHEHVIEQHAVADAPAGND